jgi:hypothetical protein
MRRFTRVVALPDPKNSDFLSRINTFRTAGLQDTWRGVGMTSAHAHTTELAQQRAATEGRPYSCWVALRGHLFQVQYVRSSER